MAQRPQPLVAGNWKMNGLKASTEQFHAMLAGFSPILAASVDVLVCPPATLILPFARLAAASELYVGAQDCHMESSGAFTGDLSAEILADAGATHVIVGHCERRSLHGETDAIVQAKALAALRAGLTAIICIGETEAEREAGRTLNVLRSQLAASMPAIATPDTVVIAYEPVWAVGTGRTPTRSEVREAHGTIRKVLAAGFGADAALTRLIYGGSVKASNAAELLSVEDVDGALVGGASLHAAEFLAIASVYPLVTS